MAATLPYGIMDADNHFVEPDDVYERYIEPAHRDLAVRMVRDAEGRRVKLYAGKPSKFDESSQITFSDAELEQMLGFVPEPGQAADRPIPGMLLNKLNPLRGLSSDERDALIAEFREQHEAHGNAELRLALMDEQGIEAALMFPNNAHDLEYQFADDVDAIYANFRAFNRWAHDEIGFCRADRLFLPPYIPLADAAEAAREVETVIDQGATIIQIKAGHAHGGRDNPHGGRSIADPVFDPVWARINEAGVRVAVHLGATDYQKYGADWSEDPDETLGGFDAFQWVFYWGDRPAMETVGGMIMHNLFGRFPDIKVCIAEQGTVWLPYLLAKMDHAFHMGRKAKWGDFDRRPKEIFADHFVVAPFPEENIQRALAAVGPGPLVFGSDFPHGEGLAYPSEYVDSQLAGLPDDQVKMIMRDNLAGFLGLEA